MKRYCKANFIMLRFLMKTKQTIQKISVPIIEFLYVIKVLLL